MNNDTWLKLHTSLLTSSKYVGLPSNDHRTAFISLLLLAKKGLESAPECYLLGHIFLSKRRWKVVRQDLIHVGLLDESGSVKGFEESQLTPSAIRVRRHRSVTKGVASNVTCNGDSRKQRVESREECEEEADSHTPKVDKSLPRGTPASPATVDYATSILRKQGKTVEGWLAEHDLEGPLTSADMDEIKAQAESEPVLSADDQATQARNAVLRRIKAELDEVHERDGPDAARRLIRAQDKKLHGALWGRFKELEPEAMEAKA